MQSKYNKEAVKKWRLKMKQHLVDLTGGKCRICGYNESIYALEFHHYDPREKEFRLSSLVAGSRRAFDECKKCVLLCSNCHKRVHCEDLYCPEPIWDNDKAGKILEEEFLRKHKLDGVDILSLKKKLKTNVAVAKHLNVSETAIRKRLKSLTPG